MSAYTCPTCGFCENPPVAVCDGANCKKPVCSVHRIATWPSPDGTSRLDYCDCCINPQNAPEPIQP